MIRRPPKTTTSDTLVPDTRAADVAVQLFDSWAVSLSPAQFKQWVITPTRSIVDQLRVRCPGIPIIGFPKGAGGKLVAYAEETGVDGIGIDETVDPHWANAVLQIGRAHV